MSKFSKSYFGVEELAKVDEMKEANCIENVDQE
jgi:hypothetical protein